MRSDTLTASRMAALLACPRKHYWRYEVGLGAAVSAGGAAPPQAAESSNSVVMFEARPARAMGGET